MYKKQNLLPALLGLTLLTVVFLMACKKDPTTGSSQPKHHLVESEKLVLPTTVELPAHPNGYARVVTLYATGVQKYKAQQRSGSNPVVYDWTFVAPEAVLYDNFNQQLGTHGAGPFWQLQADSIFAQAMTPARTSASPQGAIDWLLLVPKVGKNPTGRFELVNYIQRIATTGGKAPVSPPASANETVSIPYTAVYRFSKLNL